MVRRGTLDMPVIGVAKAGWTLEQLKARAQRQPREARRRRRPEAPSRKLARLLRYVDGDYDDPATFAIAARRRWAARAHPLHYLAIPPSLFATVGRAALRKSGCADGARVVVEKPFGRDLASAQELNRVLHAVFPESAIFRIDHYLGKEPVQNLLYFRFANSFLEPIWNRSYVQSVADHDGRELRRRRAAASSTRRPARSATWCRTTCCRWWRCLADGAARGDDDRVHPRRAREAAQVDARRSTPADVVRGQFRGYRKEPGVAPDSQVETFAALRLYIDNWRWAGVPFFIRAGKCLPVTATEVVVELKRPPAFFDVDPRARQPLPLPPEPGGGDRRWARAIKAPGRTRAAPTTSS